MEGAQRQQRLRSFQRPDLAGLLEALSDVVDALKIAAALTSRVFARPSLPLAPLRHSFRSGMPVPSAMTQTSGAAPPASSFAWLSSFGKSRTAS